MRGTTFLLAFLLIFSVATTQAQPDAQDMRKRAELSDQWWGIGLKKLQTEDFAGALEAFVTRRTKYPYPHLCGNGAASDAYLHALYEGYCLEKLGRLREAALRYAIGAHEPSDPISGVNLLRLVALYRDAGRLNEFAQFVSLVQKREDDVRSQLTGNPQLDAEYRAQRIRGAAKRPLNQMAKLAQLESRGDFRGIVVTTLQMTTPPTVESSWPPLEPLRQAGPRYATILIRRYNAQLVPLFEQRMKTASPREQSALLIALALSGTPQAADVVARRAKELKSLITHHAESAWRDSYNATVALALSGRSGRSTVERWAKDNSPVVSSLASSALQEAQRFSENLVVFISPTEDELIHKTTRSGLPAGEELWKALTS